MCPAATSSRCFVALLLLVLAPFARARNWQTFKNCHLLPNAANDGDSFHVRAEGKEYIFRLYFVDTPETENSLPNRVKEQAKYFHVTVPETLQVGLEAERFMRRELGRPFTVRTCLQDARGRSRLPRYFAFVQIDNFDLGELLVANGLARVFGAASDPPDMNSPEVEWRKLEQLERKAKEQKIGGWGIGSGRLNNRASTQPGTSVDDFEAFFHPHGPSPTPSATQPAAPGTRLDLNEASIGALQDLPGVGLVLAKRIIAARPFKSADDLRQVKGIGAKKYAILRPYFQ
jgi:DNA uptake protein ComE-like DNA-binding protein